VNSLCRLVDAWILRSSWWVGWSRGGWCTIGVSGDQQIPGSARRWRRCSWWRSAMCTVLLVPGSCVRGRVDPAASGVGHHGASGSDHQAGFHVGAVGRGGSRPEGPRVLCLADPGAGRDHGASGPEHRHRRGGPQNCSPWCSNGLRDGHIRALTQTENGRGERLGRDRARGRARSAAPHRSAVVGWVACTPS